MVGRIAMAWGVLGFLFLLGQALVRLWPLALEPFGMDQLSSWYWLLYGASIVLMAYYEGYKGFHLKAAPRVVARGVYLRRHPRPLFVLLAPLFCMSLFHANRRRLITSWVFYAALILLILAVRQVPQPWRGAIDAGVVIGLSLGALSVLYFFAKALAGQTIAVLPDLPER
jgi:hypothetical protein